MSGLQPTGLRVVNMLWIGDRLSPIEQLSIRSFISQGHPVHLFTFGEVNGIPAGTQVLDARDFMSDNEYKQLRHRKSGSYSLAADLFRYRLMQVNAGFWSDADFVCLKPVSCAESHVFGWENETHLCNGFLYLPPESPVLTQLLDYFEYTRVPPWLSRSKRYKLHMRRLLGQHIRAADLPWGVFGPKGLTWLARHNNVIDQAQAQTVFYAHPLANAEQIFDARYRLEDVQAAETVLLHLWNERIKERKYERPEVGSLLHTLYDRFDIVVINFACRWVEMYKIRRTKFTCPCTGASHLARFVRNLQP